MVLKLAIILSLCFAALPVLAQLTPPAQTGISSLQRKLNAKKDSLSPAVDKYVQPGKVIAAKKDTTPVRKPMPGLAKVADEEVTPPAAFMPSLDHNSCKALVFLPKPADSGNYQASKTPPAPPKAAPASPHTPFLQIHGNVLYNLNYYSRIDTPYNERNVYQHTIQTWLDVLVKGQYPFRVFLTNHFSNSKLFPNYSDFNLGYNNYGFNQQIRDELRKEYLASLPGQKQIDSLQQLLTKDWQKLKGLEGFGKNPSVIQKLVEAREAAALGKKPDSTKHDDEMDSIYAIKKQQADSLRREITRVQQLLQGAKGQSQTAISQNLAAIQKLDNPDQVRKELPNLGIGDSALPKGYKTLMAIKSFGIGRTVVNYSELSVKNISVNGVQAEYNPGNYYAFATGGVDYRFRDFIVQEPNQSHQYLNVFRVGRGLKNGNNIILTYFVGKRQLYNSATTDTLPTQTPSSSLMGFTVQGNYHLTKNILFTAEAGKSSSPSYTGDSTHKSSSSLHLFSMNDRTNEAWSTQLKANFPETYTRVTASYKHLAQNYQSFSVFTDGSATSAWAVNVDQLFFKKQLDINVGANTNDFSNPLIGSQYKSTTVFKSIQATLRKRYWPTISLGYFPSSQMTKLGDGGYIENLFYTLVGNLTQSYQVHQLLMNTTVVYTQFYNRAADSGFTYFNTKNLMVSQSLFLNQFTFQVNATAATNQDYQLYTLEGKLQHAFCKWLTLGAGVKYNHQTGYNIDQMGYSAEATLKLNKLGQVQFSADKGYIPGMNNILVPDNTGRLTYIKTF